MFELLQQSAAYFDSPSIAVVAHVRAMVSKWSRAGRGLQLQLQLLQLERVARLAHSAGRIVSAPSLYVIRAARRRVEVKNRFIRMKQLRDAREGLQAGPVALIGSQSSAQTFNVDLHSHRQEAA